MDLKANTAVDILIGPFVDSTDGVTAETGLTLSQADIQLSKNGQTLAQKNDTTAATHDANGYYNCELDATDTNTEGNLVVTITESGALPVRHEFNVLAEAAWDSLYAAKDTGFMDVNIKAVSEDETAADNLESACDNYSATRGLAGTALPAAAADAAGGLPISDAGGLNMDGLASTGDAMTLAAGAITNASLAGNMEIVFETDFANNYDTTNDRWLVDSEALGGQTVTAGAGITINAEVGASATAMDNFEDQYDGTGLTGDTFPATQAQVNAISSSSSALVATAADDNGNGTDPLNSVSFVGVITGTIANLDIEDGTVVQIDDTGNAFDWVVQHNIPANAVPVNVEIAGFLNGSNDAANVQVYDHDATSWVTKATWTGKSGSSNDNFIVPLGESRWASAAGAVYVRHVCTGQSNPDLNVDRQVVSYLNQTVGYSQGAIWIDTNNGTAGTTDFINGTADNPVDSLADGLTLSASLNLNSFMIATGSSITLSASADNYHFEGNAWTLDFGSQSIAGAFFKGATVSGTFSGATAILEDCIINAITGPGITMRRCFFNEVTITANGVGNWFLNDCRSRVAGSSNPNFDFGAGVGNTSFNLRNYSGGIEIENMGDTGTDTASIEGRGNIVFNANCDGGNCSVRGAFTRTDNSGNVTITEDARLDMPQINAEVLDVINTDTFAEPGQEAPGATVSLATKIGYLYKAWRNRSTTTSSQYSLYNDDATTVDQKSTLSDNGTTADKTEVESGP